MANIRPFRALRPKKECASSLCELPYDVVSTEEARAAVAGKDHSFYRISRPEINFPQGTDPYAQEVYKKARELFDSWISEGWIGQDTQSCFYLYRQIMGNHSQLGLVALASCKDYQEGIVRKHELTRIEKENDRIRHIEALNAQTGPAFLTYPSNSELNSIFGDKIKEAPMVDFTGTDSVRHTSWVIDEREIVARIEKIFAQIPRLYIADGHHRSAAATRIYQKKSGQNGSDGFLAVIFPHDQMQILAYNRAVKDLNGLEPAAFLEKLKNVFDFSEIPFSKPTVPGEVGLFVDGKWIGLRFKKPMLSANTATDASTLTALLDVQMLQDKVLEPLLGIQDPRTSNRISFVGGIRGTKELEKLVMQDGYACAFSMYPTQIEQIMNIADAGGIMPPKSTWFEPKLRDAMFIYRYPSE